MKRFAVAGTFIRDDKHGTQNIVTYINVYEAHSFEEALGKVIVFMGEEYPKHMIFGRPVAVEIDPPKAEIDSVKEKLPERG